MFSNTVWFATYIILLILVASASLDQLYDEIEEHDNEILPYCTSNFNNGSWGPCPPWSTCQNTSCRCAKTHWEVHINCTQRLNSVIALHMTKEMRDLFKVRACTAVQNVRLVPSVTFRLQTI